MQQRQHGDNGAGVNRLGEDAGRSGTKKTAQEGRETAIL
jgi:hypothetical protein